MLIKLYQLNGIYLKSKCFILSQSFNLFDQIAKIC